MSASTGVYGRGDDYQIDKGRFPSQVGCSIHAEGANCGCTQFRQRDRKRFRFPVQYLRSRWHCCWLLRCSTQEQTEAEQQHRNHEKVYMVRSCGGQRCGRHSDFLTKSNSTCWSEDRKRVRACIKICGQVSLNGDHSLCVRGSRSDHSRR